MNRILVTGATGFIGRRLVQRLIDERFQVLATRRPSSDVSGFVDIECRLDWIELDQLGNWKAVLRSEPRWDAVVHLATHYGRQSERLSEVVATNLLFPMQLLELAVEKKTELFLNTDTCFRADYPYLRPYTLSKKQWGQWGELVTSESTTRFLTLELQHPYGPGDRPGKFVPWIIEQCLQSDESISLTSGLQEKDFIFVDDVVDAYLVVIRRWRELAAETSIIPCGTGRSVSVREFVESIHRRCSSRSTLAFGRLPDRPGEALQSVAETQLLRDLGWEAKTSMEEGISITVDEARRAKVSVART